LQVPPYRTRFDLGECADIDLGNLDSSSLGCSPSSASTRQDDLDPGVAEIGSDFASEDRRRRGDRGSSSKVEVEV
jgi:hypothetical protein